MRRAARTDRNQQDVIDALRRVGASVCDTSRLGEGFPDLVVGFRADNFMLEVKDGTKPPSARKLTLAEEEFINNWRGTVYVVNNVDEALQAIGAIR